MSQKRQIVIFIYTPNHAPEAQQVGSQLTIAVKKGKTAKFIKFPFTFQGNLALEWKPPCKADTETYFCFSKFPFSQHDTFCHSTHSWNEAYKWLFFQELDSKRERREKTFSARPVPKDTQTAQQSKYLQKHQLSPLWAVLELFWVRRQSRLGSLEKTQSN